MKKSSVSKLITLLKGVIYFLLIGVTLIWFVHFEQGILQAAYILCALVVDLFCVYVLLNKRKHKVLCAGILSVALLVLLTMGAFWAFYSRIGAYPVEPVQTAFFQNKHVLVIVPHQDDDINLVGGIAEQYTHSGSRVSVAYTTNGDYFDLSETRFREALDVAGQMGIPAEDVYFLGFGDLWKPIEVDGQSYDHIYHSPDKTLLWTSGNNRQETYGTSLKDCYQIRDYTRNDYVDSIRSLILELRPDVIYAVDYDSHKEHRGTTLLFDEAMCSILRTGEDYHPKVYKGFCYRTAWTAPADFLHQNNILSSVRPEITENSEVEIPQYPWENRVRVPVLPRGLNRFLSQTEGFQQLSTYWSQGAKDQACNVINGDKVFWERRTDSLLYDGKIFLGDQQTELLNDFKLMDSSDISGPTVSNGILPVEKAIRVSLPEPENLRVLGLYEDPGEENQILEGYVQLESGEKIDFGPLHNNGTATYILLPENVGMISSFEIYVTGFRGIPGLTEIGAYAEQVPASDNMLQYFMFVDEDDNFVYDYYMDSDNANFTLYTYPLEFPVNAENFNISMKGSRACSYTFEDGQLRIYCPKYAKCQFEVRYDDIVTYLSVSHPGALKTWLIDTVKQLDYEQIYGTKPFSLEDQVQYYREFIAKLQIRFESLL